MRRASLRVARSGYGDDLGRCGKFHCNRHRSSLRLSRVSCPMPSHVRWSVPVPCHSIADGNLRAGRIQAGQELGQEKRLDTLGRLRALRRRS